MRKSLIIIMQTLKSLSVVTAVVSIVMCIGTLNNDALVFRMAFLFILSVIMACFTELSIRAIKHKQIDYAEQESIRMFYDVHPIRTGWEFRSR